MLQLLRHLWLFCDPMDCRPKGSSVHEILQAEILGWVDISFSVGSSQSKDQTRISFFSCIGRWILYHWATWEAQVSCNNYNNKYPFHDFNLPILSEQSFNFFLRENCLRITVKIFLLHLSFLKHQVWSQKLSRYIIHYTFNHCIPLCEKPWSYFYKVNKNS